MTYFIKRTLGVGEGWTGPIRSITDAEDQVTGWRANGWEAEIVQTNTEIDNHVSAWAARRGLA